MAASFSPSSRFARRQARVLGFTLVELMVVIVIIGLLAGIVAVSVAGRDDDAKVVKAQSETKALYDAVQMYKSDNGDYPESLESLVSTEDGGRRYLTSTSVPKDPWGGEYIFDTDNLDSSGEFRILCYAKDGEPGGDDKYTKDIIYPPEPEDE